LERGLPSLGGLHRSARRGLATCLSARLGGSTRRSAAQASDSSRWSLPRAPQALSPLTNVLTAERRAAAVVAHYAAAHGFEPGETVMPIDYLAEPSARELAGIRERRGRRAGPLARRHHLGLRGPARTRKRISAPRRRESRKSPKAAMWWLLACRSTSRRRPRPHGSSGRVTKALPGSRRTLASPTKATLVQTPLHTERAASLRLSPASGLTSTGGRGGRRRSRGHP
jgi:hypothetical protein